MSNVDIVNSAYRSFAKGDIPGVIDLLDDSVSWSSPMTLPQGGQFDGKDGVVRFFETIGGAWESLSLDVEAVDAVSDDLVVSVVSLSGTLRGSGPASYGSTHAFTVRDGKITRFREYVDADKALV
jgi:ketosteroid isomerase-like protein